MHQNIWLPDLGVVPIHTVSAGSAVEEYDPSLILGQREDTGEWIVFKKEGPNGQPFPVFNLGMELPGPDEIKRRLYNADIRRHGGKLIDQIERKNEAARKRLRDEAHDAAGEAAEAIDWGMRKVGALPQRIFVPTDIKE